MTDPELHHIWNLNEHWRWAEAETAARAYLVHNPGSACIHAELAHALHQLSRLDEAALAADEACRLDPTDPWFFIVHSRIAVARHRGEDAVASARCAFDLAPFLWNAHHQLADAYLTHLDARGTHHFRPKEAIGPAREAMRLAPGSPAPHHALAHALKALGRRREGRTAYRAALALDPNRVLVLVALAGSYSSLRPGPAARHLSTALRLRPSLDVARKDLSWVVDRWMRDVAWIWLVGAAAAAAVRYVATPWVALGVVALTAAVCCAGTWSLVRHLPPSGLRDIWWHSRRPARSRLGAIVVSALAALTIAAGPVAAAASAGLVAALLAVALWRLDFARLEWRIRTWRASHRRSPT